MSDVNPGVETRSFEREEAPSSSVMQDSVLVSGIETAEAFVEEGRRWAGERSDTARELIRENPLTMAGAVFGAGVLFGMLLNRR